MPQNITKLQIIFLNHTHSLLDFIKKYKYLFFVLGLLITLVVGAKDVNYWGLQAKSGKQLLKDVSRGAASPRNMVLSEKQFEEIKKLISKNPDNYSNQQKVLISDKSGEQILQELTEDNISEIDLNYKQFQEILSLINKNPNNYTTLQKTLIKEKTGEEILKLVGLGIRKPSSFKLSKNQYQEIKTVLLSNPQQYSILQQSLVPEIKEQLELIVAKRKESGIISEELNLTAKELLLKVGLGEITPQEVKLTDIQKEEIKQLISNNPDAYNVVQKSLLK